MQLQALSPVELLDLCSLLRITPHLFDWPWQGLFGDEFRARFSESWVAHKFQAAVRDLSNWWLCDAKVNYVELHVHDVA